MPDDVSLTSVLDVVEEVVEGFGDVSGRATQLHQRVLVPLIMQHQSTKYRYRHRVFNKLIEDQSF